MACSIGLGEEKEHDTKVDPASLWKSKTVRETTQLDFFLENEH
jgi:hypothetical protein